jgi:hypothetical protein
MAIQHTLFISATRLKKDTALGGSVDDNLIMPYILLAQDMKILPVLGTDLYEALKTKINGGTLTGDYKTLMETYIQPALVQFAFAQLAPYLRLRFVNNAVDDIKPLMSTAEDAAQFYRQRLIDYLTDKGSSAFPEYASNSDAGEMSPTVRNYYAGLNLDIAPVSNRVKSFLQGANITTYDC